MLGCGLSALIIQFALERIVSPLLHIVGFLAGRKRYLKQGIPHVPDGGLLSVENVAEGKHGFLRAMVPC